MDISNAFFHTIWSCPVTLRYYLRGSGKSHEDDQVRYLAHFFYALSSGSLIGLIIVPFGDSELSSGKRDFF